MRLFEEVGVVIGSSKDVSSAIPETQRRSVSSRNAFKKMKQHDLVTPNYVRAKNCQSIADKKQRSGRSIQPGMENGNPKGGRKDVKRCEDEICMTIVEKLYSKVADIMHRCREAAKRLFLFDNMYISQTGNTPVLT